MEEKKSSKLIWLLVPLALIIGLALGLSAYYWQKSSLERKLKDEKAQLQAELKKTAKTISELEAKIKKLEPEGEEGPSSKSGTRVTGTTPSTPREKREIGVIKRVYSSGGKRYLDIDYIQFLTGDEANAAAIEDDYIEPGDTVPNDYYIRNVNPRIRTFEISNSVAIIAQTYTTNPDGSFVFGDDVLDFSTFKTIFETNDPRNQNMIHNPYWITLRGDLITKIEEQYLP